MRLLNSIALPGDTVMSPKKKSPPGEKTPPEGGALPGPLEGVDVWPPGTIRAAGERLRRLRARTDAADQPVEADTKSGRELGHSLDRTDPARLRLGDGPLVDAENRGDLGLLPAGSRPGKPNSFTDLAPVLRDHAVSMRDVDIVAQVGTINRLFGSAVRDNRKAQGLTQIALADAMGTTQGRLSRLENGDQWLMETAARAAMVLGIPVAELLGGTVLAPEENTAIDAMRSGQATPVLLVPEEVQVIDAMRRGDFLRAMQIIAEVSARKK